MVSHHYDNDTVLLRAVSSIIFVAISSIFYITRNTSKKSTTNTTTVTRDGRTYALPPFVKNLSNENEIKVLQSKYQLGAFSQWMKETGPIVRLKVKSPYKMVTLLDDIDLTRKILKDKESLVTEYATLVRHHYNGGDSIVTSEGVFWQHSRKGMAPAFGSRHIRRMNDLALSNIEYFITEELGSYVISGKSFDVMSSMMDITLPVIFKAAFQYDINHEEKEFFVKENRIIAEATIQLKGNPSMCFTPDQARASEASKQVEAFGFKVLESYRKCESPEEGTVIDHIVKNKDYKNDKERVNDIVIVLLAGFYTTSATITWALLELAKNQSEQASLRNELKSMPAEKRIGSPCLMNVIKETMRLRPIFPVFSREIKRDVILGKTEKNGLETDILIPKGSVVNSLLYRSLRNSDIFEDPDEFKPTRWINPSKEAEATFIPFSLGRRSCLGQSLANAEIKNALAKFCTDYSFRLDKEGDIIFDGVYQTLGTRLFVSAA